MTTPSALTPKNHETLPNKLKSFLFKLAKITLQSLTVSLVKDYLHNNVMKGEDPLHLRPVLQEIVCGINNEVNRSTK